MAFDAEDIRQKKLSVTVFRGYSIKEADDFFDLVASEFEKLQNDNKALGEKILELEIKIKASANQTDHSIEERLGELERRLQAQ